MVNLSNFQTEKAILRGLHKYFQSGSSSRTGSLGAKRSTAQNDSWKLHSNWKKYVIAVWRIAGIFFEHCRIEKAQIYLRFKTIFGWCSSSKFLRKNRIECVWKFRSCMKQNVQLTLKLSQKDSRNQPRIYFFADQGHKLDIGVTPG